MKKLKLFLLPMLMLVLVVPIAVVSGRTNTPISVHASGQNGEENPLERPWQYVSGELGLDAEGNIWSDIFGDPMKITLPQEGTVLPQFSHISSARGTHIAICENGALWSWGLNGVAGANNAGGWLGQGTSPGVVTRPRNINAWLGLTFPAFKRVQTAGQFTGAIDTNGQIWTWGWGAASGWNRGNTHPQIVRTPTLLTLGHGGFGSHGGQAPQANSNNLLNNWNFIDIAVGGDAQLNNAFMFALQDGDALGTGQTLWSWGASSGGPVNLGHQSPVSNNFGWPTRINHANARYVSAISVSNFHGLLVRGSAGYVYEFGGQNNLWPMAQGTSTSAPRRVQGLEGIVEVNAGEFGNMARHSDGRVFTWGRGASGMLGHGDNYLEDNRTPRYIESHRFIGATIPQNPNGTGSEFQNQRNVIINENGRIYRWGNWAPTNITTPTFFAGPELPIVIPQVITVLNKAIVDLQDAIQEDIIRAIYSANYALLNALDDLDESGYDLTHVDILSVDIDALLAEAEAIIAPAQAARDAEVIRINNYLAQLPYYLEELTEELGHLSNLITSAFREEFKRITGIRITTGWIFNKQDEPVKYDVLQTMHDTGLIPTWNNNLDNLPLVGISTDLELWKQKLIDTHEETVKVRAMYSAIWRRIARTDEFQAEQPWQDMNATDLAVFIQDIKTMVADKHAHIIEFNGIEGNIVITLSNLMLSTWTRVNPLRTEVEAMQTRLEFLNAQTSLQGVITTAQARVQAMYTTSTWALFATAITDAQTALTNATTPAELNAARANLETAMANLVTLTQQAINDARANLASAIGTAQAIQNNGVYANLSWNIFQQIILSAVDVYENATVTAQELIDAREDILWKQSHLITVELYNEHQQLALLLTQANLRQQVNYTPATWGPFATARTNASALLCMESIDVKLWVVEMDINVVNNARTTLQNAMNSLVTVTFANAQTNLQNSITTAQARVQANYAPSTWIPFATALTNAQTALANATTVVALDTARTNLTTAMNALVTVEVYTAHNQLQEIILTAQGRVQVNYTTATWKPFSTALSNAQAALTTATTALELDNARIALQTTMNALVEIAFESAQDELQTAITAAQGRLQANYGASTWTPFATSLSDAVTALATASTVAELNTARTTLQNAMNGLVAIELYNARIVLQGIITTAQSRSQANYTIATWASFSNALSQAQTALTNSTNASELESAGNALIATMENLETIVQEAQRVLSAAITLAGLRMQGTYTAVTWAPFATALTNAQIAFDTATTINALNDARIALSIATDNLVTQATAIANQAVAQSAIDDLITAIAGEDVIAMQNALNAMNTALGAAGIETSQLNFGTHANATGLTNATESRITQLQESNNGGNDNTILGIDPLYVGLAGGALAMLVLVGFIWAVKPKRK